MLNSPTCGPCAHDAEHGWWGIDGTHCRTCHRTWTGFAECHCAGCHRHFGGVGAFDAHFNGDECGDPPTHNSSGKWIFKLIDRASGPVWVHVVAAGSFKRPQHATLSLESDAKPVLVSGAQEALFTP